MWQASGTSLNRNGEDSLEKKTFKYKKKYLYTLDTFAASNGDTECNI